MTVAVLIVNWNGGDLLQRCLEALRRQRRAPDHIVVVDNGSRDGSLEAAASLLRDVQLVRLPDNRGFAAANNIAARAAARFDWLALVNPDAFAEPEWLEALMNAAASTGFSSFASQLRLASDSRLLDGAGDAYHVSGRAWRHGHAAPVANGPAKPCEVFAPCAAAALYRRDAFESVGGFDERYFCYFEDVDLGFRLRLQGHRTLYVPAAIVNHVSSAMSGYRSNFAVYHGERNMVWTYVKDMPSPLLWRYLPQHIALNLASLAYYPWRGQGLTVFRAKFDALKGLPAVIRDRRQVQRSLTADARSVREAMTTGWLTPYLRRYTMPATTGDGA